MNAIEFKKRITDGFLDMDFVYKGKSGSICPFSDTDISLSYNGETKDFHDIDLLMSFPFFEGKALTDILSLIDID